jgi:hypothetical protein
MKLSEVRFVLVMCLSVGYVNFVLINLRKLSFSEGRYVEISVVSLMSSSLVLQEGGVQEKVGQVCRAVRQALELQDNTEYKQGKTFFLPYSSYRRLNMELDLQCLFGLVLIG